MSQTTVAVFGGFVLALSEVVADSRRRCEELSSRCKKQFPERVQEIQLLVRGARNCPRKVYMEESNEFRIQLDTLAFGVSSECEIS